MPVDYIAVNKLKDFQGVYDTLESLNPEAITLEVSVRHADELFLYTSASFEQLFKYSTRDTYDDEFIAAIHYARDHHVPVFFIDQPYWFVDDYDGEIQECMTNILDDCDTLFKRNYPKCGFRDERLAFMGEVHNQLSKRYSNIVHVGNSSLHELEIPFSEYTENPGEVYYATEPPETHRNFLYIDPYFQVLNDKTLRKQLPPDLEKISGFIPQEICDILDIVPEETRSCVQITQEQLKKMVFNIAKRVSPHVKEYFQAENSLCMDFTAVLGGYLAEALGFPVVGLYDPADDSLENYIRPITSVMDCGSMEDLLEIKIGNSRFAVDFNLYFNKREVIFEDIGTFEKRIKFSEKYGLWTSQYKSFDISHFPEQIREFFEAKEITNKFGLIVGNQKVLQNFKQKVMPMQGDLIAFYEDLRSFKMTKSGVTFREHIFSTSTGARISQGYRLQHMCGSGITYIFYKDYTSFHKKMILTELPHPKEAIHCLT